MKKILVFIFCTLSFFFGLQELYAVNCSYNPNGSVTNSLGQCLQGTDVVQPGDALLENGLKNKVYYWSYTLIGAIGLFAIGAMVYGGFLMTISGGEDEKVKKGKDVIKWAILGFGGALLAGVIVRFVIEIMFAIGG